MTLAPGTQVGPFQITAPLGAGGMGEVYRASDIRLKREVALKVLPEAFAHDSQRMARFGREAQLLASLNHSHIAHLYGLEESNGIRALVMELVEGSTLAERIAKGPIAVNEAAEIGKQIADALEYAHDKRVIHRDLKPSNIKMDSNGQVKVLDFGLAKAMETDGSELDISTSPTISIAASRAGVLLGTAAYMSPEQAKGKTVDRRADIWAFGCVLFEMLAGKPAFGGETITDTLAAVVRAEPEWRQLPNHTPRALRELLRRCLVKDPKLRLQAIGEARIVIDELLAGAPDDSGATVSTNRTRGLLKYAGWIIAAICFVGLLAALGIRREGGSKEGRIVQFDISPPERAALGLPSWPAMAISPDGTQIVYRVFERDGTPLYVRNIGSLTSQLIPGTESAFSPFFSPDGRWLAFFASKGLKRISLVGGDASDLADISGIVDNPWGATWSPDGNIYVSSTDGLYRVPEGGGTWEKVVTTGGKQTAIFTGCRALPNKRAVLSAVGASGNFAQSRIVAIRTDTKQQKTLIEAGTDPHFVEPDTLVYLHDGTLMAVQFDPNSLEIHGTAVPVLEDISSAPVYGVGEFDVSPSGTLAYYSASTAAKSVENTLLWRNRRGEMQAVGLKPGMYQAPRLSPDGHLLAVAMQGRETEIWIYDLERGTMRRMTFGPGEDEVPVWSPDGKRVAYSANGRGRAFCFTVDGSHPEELLMSRTNHFHLYSWSPDGKFIAFESGAIGKFGIWILPMFGDRKPYPYLQNAFNLRTPVFSPDGKWLAYSSNESGQPQIYVQRFPGPGETVQVSAAGGITPVWERDGRALFFRNGRMLMKAAVTTSPTLSVGKPLELFETGVDITAVHTNYDVSPDGSRFVIVEGGNANAANPLHVILNWGTELGRRITPPH